MEIESWWLWAWCTRRRIARPLPYRFPSRYGRSKATLSRSHSTPYSSNSPQYSSRNALLSPRGPPRRIQSSFSGSTAPFRLIRGSFESHRFPLSNDPAINPNAPLIVRQRPQHCPYPLPDAVRLFSMFVVFVFASRNRSLHSWYLQHYRGPSYHIPSGLKPHWPPPYARYRGPRTLSLVRLRRSSRRPHDIIVCSFWKRHRPSCVPSRTFL